MKSSTKKPATKTAAPKKAKKKVSKSIKVKDLSPRKNPQGGTSDHDQKGGGWKSDY